jgi:hypothetical protein
MTPIALLAAAAIAKATAPPPVLPSLPVITRARVEVTRDAVVVIEDVTFARGEWSSGDYDLFIAFGAPGVPQAFDAHLLATPADAFGAPLDQPGEALPSDRAPRKPDRATTLLGSPHMAGEVVHAREVALRRGFSASGVVTLRVRSLIATPPADANGTREVLVRLGSLPSNPLALASVELASKDSTVRLESAEAKLCGPDADPYPIAVTSTPTLPRVPPWPVSPLGVVRRATDDLCVRWRVATPPKP